MQSQPGATIESHREGPITQGEVGKGVQRLDPKQDKKLRKEGVRGKHPRPRTVPGGPACSGYLSQGCSPQEISCGFEGTLKA